MNKLIIIATSMLILLQSMNIHFNDLAEMDEFVEHYKFHSEEYGDSFLVFLSKHYGDQKVAHNQKHQEEQKEHEKLPFQHQTQCAQPLVFVMDHNSFMESRSEIPVVKKGDFHYQISYSHIWGDNPFQPPKHA